MYSGGDVLLADSNTDRHRTMKSLVILYFGTATASFFQAFFTDHQIAHPTTPHDVDCHHDHTTNDRTHFSRPGTYTSPGSFWRILSTTSGVPFTEKRPYHKYDFDKGRERNEDEFTESPKSVNGKDNSGPRLKPWATSQKTYLDFGPSTLDPAKESFQGTGVGRLRLAEKWCSKYEKKCKSRRANSITLRITGGTPAKPKEHPHMVLVGYGEVDKKTWLCGGSLISSRYVLSAAHCSRPPKWGPARWARLGDLDISTTEEESRPQDREIVERILHPGYREPEVYHDIALFRMDSDVVFDSWVSPACLHVGRNIAAPVATVTGWGRIDFVSETSPVLLKVNVGIFNDSYCNSTVNRKAGSKMPRGFDARTMICAGDRAGGKDACQGDSGGPMVIFNEGCAKTQVGITSIGSDCGLPDNPGVYTRVSEYVSWIEDIVWN